MKPNYGPNDIQAIPETILLLLGDQEGASRSIAERIEDAPVWERRRLEVVSTPIIELSALLAEFDANHSERMWINWLVSCRLWGAGNRDDAGHYLNECVQSLPLSIESAWARAFLGRIREN